MIYNSLAKSHLEYGILAWGNANSKRIGKIGKLQKKLVRNLTGAKFLSHTDPLFAKTKILKYEDIFTLNANKFMYKFNNKALPESFLGFFQPLTLGNRTNSYRVDLIKDTLLKMPNLTISNCFE